MNSQAKSIASGRILISSKPVFVSTITTILLTVLTVWIWGSTIHRTIFGNALISTHILTAICIAALTIGLFNGVKLKDTLGKITDEFKWPKFPKWRKVQKPLKKSSLKESSTWDWELPNFFEMDGDIFEIIGHLLYALVILLLSLFFLWVFGNLLWAGTLMAEATLYWIFFRAVRLVFKRARQCKGKWGLSFMYGFLYTALYSFIFYTLILVPYFLHQ